MADPTTYNPGYSFSDFQSKCGSFSGRTKLAGSRPSGIFAEAIGENAPALGLGGGGAIIPYLLAGPKHRAQSSAFEAI